MTKNDMVLAMKILRQEMNNNPYLFKGDVGLDELKALSIAHNRVRSLKNEYDANEEMYKPFEA